MPHPLTSSLLKVLPLFIALYDNPEIEQLLENRCKAFKDRLLLLRESLHTQFKTDLEKGLFAISIKGIHINQCLRTSSINNSNPAISSSTKDEQNTPETSSHTLSSENSPATFIINIVIHGLLQGDEMLFEEVLNTNTLFNTFLQQHISLLTEAYQIWLENEFTSSHKKMKVTFASEQWLTALTLALNEVNVLVWYYLQRKIVERDFLPAKQEGGESGGTTGMKAKDHAIDIVFPYVVACKFKAEKVELDKIQTCCHILARRFPLTRLWAVESLLSQLKRVNHLNAEDGSKLLELKEALSRLPENNSRERYLKELQDVISRFESPSADVSADRKRKQGFQPQSDKQKKQKDIPETQVTPASANSSRRIRRPSLPRAGAYSDLTPLLQESRSHRSSNQPSVIPDSDKSEPSQPTTENAILKI